jgi:hypothetical protein
MIGALLAIAGAAGVIVFAFLSWRSLGGSERNPDATELARNAPPTFKWAGRACAMVFAYGVFRFFTS